MRDDRSFFQDDDPIGSEPTCRHWQGSGACSEVCACGHGCGEHHEAGWCGRCGCPAWVDGPDTPGAPAASAEDGWELDDIFEDEREDYDDASGF